MKRLLAAGVALMLAAQSANASSAGEKLFVGVLLGLGAYAYNENALQSRSEANMNRTEAVRVLVNANAKDDESYTPLLRRAESLERRAGRRQLVAGGLGAVAAVCLVTGFLEVGTRDGLVEVRKSWRF